MVVSIFIGTIKSKRDVGKMYFFKLFHPLGTQIERSNRILEKGTAFISFYSHMSAIKLSIFLQFIKSKYAEYILCQQSCFIF